jgi:hypothetical protein
MSHDPTAWPKLDYLRWQQTAASLQMWLQIVGKFRLANTPWVNHSWHATLYVTARGLTTSPVPVPSGAIEVNFDFLDQRLVVLASDGSAAGFPLEPMAVADFHARFLQTLEAVGAPTAFHGSPNEVANPVPFRDQSAPGAYDPQEAHDFWRALVSIDGVFRRFRTGFLGKVSPVHLFWGSFDLAVTRFSGRPAPLHPGGIPALPDAVTREAYSHEVSSAGFWGGGGQVEEASFYSYAYPVPPGFAAARVAPAEAVFHQGLGEFLLPYEAVRRAADPTATLLSFLQSTYDAAATLGAWDRAALECQLGQPGVPRPLR